MKRITWFTVSGRDQFLVGVPLQIAGTTTGYELALDHARGAIQRPHDTVDRDLLTAECNDLAETMIQIAKEDGDALSLGAVFRAMMLEAARAEVAS